MTDDASPPSGVDPDILAAALAAPGAKESDLGCEAYDLWAAMTRLGHEVKLQGRAFAALREQLADARAAGTDSPGEKAGAAVKEALGLFREQARDAEGRAEAARRRAERAEENLLSTLADVHDRLARSVAAARTGSSGKGWPGRLFCRRNVVLDSLVEGQELALRRITDELARLGAREIPATGKIFDPETMRAVAVDASGAAPDGTVVAVMRGGWRMGDDVWRAADVVVAKTDKETAT